MRCRDVADSTRMVDFGSCMISHAMADTCWSNVRRCMMLKTVGRDIYSLMALVHQMIHVSIMASTSGHAATTADVMVSDKLRAYVT